MRSMRVRYDCTGLHIAHRAAVVAAVRSDGLKAVEKAMRFADVRWGATRFATRWYGLIRTRMRLTRCGPPRGTVS